MHLAATKCLAIFEQEMPVQASCRTYRFLSAVVLNPLLKVLSRMGVSPFFDKSQFNLLDFRSYAGETLFTKLGLTTISLPHLRKLLCRRAADGIRKRIPHTCRAHPPSSRIRASYLAQDVGGLFPFFEPAGASMVFKMGEARGVTLV